jgi:hypothetical protein
MDSPDWILIAVGFLRIEFAFFVLWLACQPDLRHHLIPANDDVCF